MEAVKIFLLIAVVLVCLENNLISSGERPGQKPGLRELEEGAPLEEFKLLRSYTEEQQRRVRPPDSEAGSSNARRKDRPGRGLKRPKKLMRAAFESK
ncbi:hypothetical protein OS493_031952 [Desmophyllum pertusum]|uniref:Uncharacterized protein n=1 Tax=Desmophyllum pertusum TaxID=174260 RepID=A0A9W9ZL09_9CNID|nr:hypothetical protein OS493_031952 [Desmophyllum pertusum]